VEGAQQQGVYFRRLVHACLVQARTSKQIIANVSYAHNENTIVEQGGG
jgi:hypothetical protein